MAKRNYKDNLVSERVELTEDIMNALNEKTEKHTIPELARRTRLPYQLVYNIVHRRVRSMSTRHYEKLFRSPPPDQSTNKSDGRHFRGMVRLWCYLNETVTEADLYTEFYGTQQNARVDYRIFTGKTKSVDKRIIRIMEDKFAAAGLDTDTVNRWIGELESTPQRKRVPYEQLRPTLEYLHESLGIHPNVMLKQFARRYETGMLKAVSPDIADHIRRTRHLAARVLETGSRQAIEALREKLYGKREGYVLYWEVMDEIQFLKKHVRGSVRRYLGRSTTAYEKGQCRRIAAWRADRIREACNAFIADHPELPLSALPRSHAQKRATPLVTALKSRIIDLFAREEDTSWEKEILKPIHGMDEYRKTHHGFTEFTLAPRTLGMRRKAFDLMVARNCEIFRGIGKYTRQWYLSDLYLKELLDREHFDLITTKYERLANVVASSPGENTCMN
jgi:hypothetical protein